MADELSSAGKRFSEDLRRIREARDVTVDEIHSETQIPRTLIESFERGELYDHPSYNEVYLRSFLKAYADMIGVPEETALDGLEAVLNGAYEGTMAAQYLSELDVDEGPSDAPADSPDVEPEADEKEDQQSSGRPSGQGGIVGPPRAVGDSEEPTIEEVSSPDANVQGVDDEETADEEEAVDDSDAEGDAEDRRQEEDPAREPTGEDGGGDDENGDQVEEEDPSGTAESGTSDNEAGDEGAGTAESSPVEEAFSDDEPFAEDDSEEEPLSDADDEGEALSEEDPEAPDPEEAREKLEEMSGPEALRSTPDEDDDETEAESQGDESEWDEEVPDWMNDDDDDSEEEKALADDDPSPSPGGEPPDLPVGESGETGIVGEPTAMGEESGAPRGQAPPDRSDSSPGSDASGGLWSGPNQQIYVTGIGIVVVLLVLIGVGIAYFSAGESDSGASSTSTASPSATDTTAAAVPGDTAPTTPAAAADTTAADTITETDDEQAERPPPADVSLGDQIHLTVYAKEPILRIQIQRDDDLRRPYWIDKGEASVFPFERRAVVQRQLSNAELYVEGYRYPVSSADTAEGLELTRDKLESFVDTLRGSPASLSVAPDTVPVGNPPGIDTTSASADDVPADTSTN